MPGVDGFTVTVEFDVRRGVSVGPGGEAQTGDQWAKLRNHLVVNMFVLQRSI